ncbi:hypothetical protein RYX36_005626, partial [Vicia faba]
MVIVSFIAKIIAVILPGYYYNVSMKDRVVIGLALNVRGIVEFQIYNLMRNGQPSIRQEKEFQYKIQSEIPSSKSWYALTMLNIIEASCASRESNAEVIALLLVELLGRSRPLLIAHQPHATLPITNYDSTQLDNALKQYARLNEGCAHVQSFTSIFDFDTIHKDTCGISFHRRANILIMSFHKRWEIDGTVE